MENDREWPQGASLVDLRKLLGDFSERDIIARRDGEDYKVTDYLEEDGKLILVLS